MPSVDMLGQYNCRLTESFLSSSSSSASSGGKHDKNKMGSKGGGQYPVMPQHALGWEAITWSVPIWNGIQGALVDLVKELSQLCLLYTSDAADEEDSVDLGGRRIIKKKKKIIISQNDILNIKKTLYEYK
eukprot:TRINITY_DN50026_c0_g1_i2.p1 TRINITY_DN50026_c0_g1~~TRINITY_DN50026_c0_g1_i2.p1  ORF type:complete len:130 (-),score=14.11 TRINITY_DN50026_c0_g1_i2:48-437(-)